MRNFKLFTCVFVSSFIFDGTYTLFNKVCQSMNTTSEPNISSKNNKESSGIETFILTFGMVIILVSQHFPSILRQNERQKISSAASHYKSLNIQFFQVSGSNGRSVGILIGVSTLCPLCYWNTGCTIAFKNC